MNQTASAASDESSRPERLAGVLFSFGLCCLTLSLLAGTILFWSDKGPVLFSAFRESALVGVSAIAFSVALLRGQLRTLKLNVSGFAWGLLALTLTDWLVRPYNLVQGDFIRGEIILGSVLTAWLLRTGSHKILSSLLLLTILLLSASFLSEAHGRLLFSDDNPTFIYRLGLLKQNFPSIPFYNPLWNAGIEARDFFATGSLNVFLLFAPLIYLFDVFQIYNLLVAALLFAVLPLSVWLSARLFGLRGNAPVIAAVLAMSSSLLWYRWALKYGTLGYVTSASLFVLNIALATRICDPDHRPSARELFFSIASFTLMLFWTPAGLAALPIGVLALKNIPRLLRKRAFISFTVLLLLLNVPWMTLFWKVSNVGSFVQTKRPNYAALADDKASQYNFGTQSAEHINTKERTGKFTISGALQRLRENSVSTNPLLVFLAIPALALFRCKGKWLLLGTSAWLIFLGTVVSQLKPQLELDRMLVMLALLLSIPTGALLADFWRGTSSRWSVLLPASLCGGFLFAGVFSTAAVLLNRSIERFYFAEPGIYKLAQTIKAEAGGGRALFSGFVLHDLYHGHLAPMVQLSKTSLIASSPFHDQWQYKEVFPKEVLQGGDTAIEDYLSLMNATLVLAHEERWKKYFSEHSAAYSPLLQGSIFELYKRNNYVSDYFLEGKGQLLEESSNSIRVRVDSESAVIKYRYYNFLQSNTCTLEPQRVSPGIDFIKISSCRSGTELTISARGPLSRLIGGDD